MGYAEQEEEIASRYFSFQIIVIFLAIMNVQKIPMIMSFRGKQL